MTGSALHEFLNGSCAGTFSTHVWRLRDATSGALLVEHVGADTTLVVEPFTPVAVLPGLRAHILPQAGPPPHREWGAYRTRCVTAIGIPIVVRRPVAHGASPAQAQHLSSWLKQMVATTACCNELCAILPGMQQLKPLT